jgi:hypothetical protein
MKAVRSATISLFLCLLHSFTAHAQLQKPKALLVFGGEDHKTFLGCLNCVNTSVVSICNKYGKFGSPYQTDSIWNPYGHFGSKYYTESPWNHYTNKAPIIVDSDGNSYGYFSDNPYHRDRTRINWIVAAFDYYDTKDDLDKTRDKFCGDPVYEDEDDDN